LSIPRVAGEGVGKRLPRELPFVKIGARVESSNTTNRERSGTSSVVVHSEPYDRLFPGSIKT